MASSGSTEQRLRAALADRYRIEGEIGAGGMAVVYLAHDLKHGRRVAVKVLRPEVAHQLGVDRFLKEIRIAAALSHPNILPLFDSGEADGLLYYVMPYIEGRTLSERIEADGALDVEDAVVIIREIGDALARAHGDGVVHRDIKPQNILFEFGHVRVADFGVARALDIAGGERLTRTGMAVGTPHYMSPEQGAGESAEDVRSDVYSLGCLAYEMLVGAPPYSGPTAQAVVAGHLSRPVPSVRERRPDVPRGVEAAVRRALAKEPDQRFQTVTEMTDALSHAMTAEAQAAERRRVVRRRWTQAVVGIGILAAVGLGVFARSPRPAGALDPARVVVTVLRNGTGDPSLDPLGDWAGNSITLGLQRTGLVRVVPWEVSLQSWQYVQGEVEAGAVRDAMDAFAGETGAQMIVSGAYYLIREELRFQAEIFDAASGEVLEALDPVTGPAADPVEAVEALKERVLGYLAVSMDERLAPFVTRSAPPPTLEASRAFQRGIELYLAYEFDEATDQFLEAFRRDSTFTTALVYAHTAAANGSRPALLDSLRLDLLGRREDLSPVGAHIVDHFEALRDGDIDGALEDLARVVELAPGSKWVYNYGLWLSRANRPKKAVEVLTTQVQPEQGGMRGWPPYFSVLADAYYMLGRYEEELEIARLGRRFYPDDIRVVQAELVALAASGRVDEALELLEEVEGLETVYGLEPGAVLVYVGQILAWHGHLEGAQAAFAEAIRWWEDRLAQDPTNPSARSMLSLSLYQAGRFEEAREQIRPLLQGDPVLWLPVAGDGVLAAAMGDRERAEEVFRWLDTLKEPPPGRLRWQAEIAANLGRREEAVSRLRVWLSGNSHSTSVLTSYGFRSLQDYPPFQELMEPKG